MTADDDGSDPSVPVPEEHDREAYLAGYARAMADIGRSALTNAELVSPGSTAPPDADPDATADEAGECRTCGAPTRASMGAKETAHSPAGRTCVACEA